jgi:hypothetical protein
MQTSDKFTMETLTEGFLKGFVSSQITEVKKNLGITSYADLTFEIKLLQLGAVIEFDWIVGAHIVNPNPNPIMEDIEHICESDYVPIAVGDSYNEVSEAINKVFERVDLTQWNGILEDASIRN